MKNIVRNLVLIAAILCPSFAMPSGEDNQFGTVLRKESYFNKYRVGRYLACGAVLGNLLFSPTDDDSPVLPFAGLCALTISFGYRFANNDYMYAVKGAKYNSLIDNIRGYVPSVTLDRDDLFYGTPLGYDYVPIKQEPKLTYLDLTKTFALRCCLPTAVSLCCYPFLKVYTPFIATAVFSNGLESCLSKADRQNRKAKKAAILQREVSRRQSIIDEKKVIFKEAKDAADEKAKKTADEKFLKISKALDDFLKNGFNVSPDSLNLLIMYIKSEESCTIHYRINKEVNDKQNNCIFNDKDLRYLSNKYFSFDSKDLADLWNQVEEAVKEDLLSEQSIFFENIDWLDEEAQNALGKIYYSYVIEEIYYSYVIKDMSLRNSFLKDDDCGAKLKILYSKPSNRFFHKLQHNSKVVMSYLIRVKKFSIIFDICALSCNLNEILSDDLKNELYSVYIGSKNYDLGFDPSQLDALEGLYTVFLDKYNSGSNEDKLLKFLDALRQKSARK